MTFSNRELVNFATSTGTLVRDVVSSSMAAVIARLDALEQRVEAIPAGPPGKDGRDGKEADSSELLEILLLEADIQIDKRVKELVASLPKAIDGKAGRDGVDGDDGGKGIDGKDGRDGIDGRNAEVDPGMVSRAVSDYFAAHPIYQPKDGRDGRDGKDGINGKDASSIARAEIDESVNEYMDAHPPKDVLPAVKKQVKAFLESLPKPEDGRDGEDGEDGKDGKPGRDGLDGKDGRSLVVDDVRPMLDALFATAALDFEKRMQDLLHREVDRLPKAKDGKDGKDGRDALPLEYMKGVLQEDGRTLTFSFGDGMSVSEFDVKFSVPQYREVWKTGQVYELADIVTHDGSMWIAMQDSVKSKPGQYAKEWRLCVKRGRNGISS